MHLVLFLLPLLEVGTPEVMDNFVLEPLFFELLQFEVPLDFSQPLSVLVQRSPIHFVLLSQALRVPLKLSIRNVSHLKFLFKFNLFIFPPNQTGLFFNLVEFLVFLFLLFFHHFFFLAHLLIEKQFHLKLLSFQVHFILKRFLVVLFNVFLDYSVPDSLGGVLLKGVLFCDTLTLPERFQGHLSA